MIKEISLALVLTASTAAAQDVVFTAEQSCFDWNSMARETASYNEEILFSAIGYQNHIAMGSMGSEVIFLVNQNTGTWSLVSLLDEETACYIASGIDFTPFLK